ncbi:hypothetical protein [Acinetobacter sp. ANC 5045]|uniref:hypothetical protein n=1 Tax=Acinetobacter sp. ANC 5045 TaxID=2529851 RepID=UPI0010397FB5|nr:hypothetical protein [Acinetobacter sp. ANC 5045]TCB20421.1 hypothetical protein E0H79_03775 [Acinetobacter sp. ANC 5045]
MKPNSFSVAITSSNTRNEPLANGTTIGKIKGQTKRLSAAYNQALVVLYDKTTLQPITIRKPDENGDYSFLGLTTNIKTFIVAFDEMQQFNAVIQDNVVSK